MTLSPAPLHSEIADGPEGGCAYWLTTSDGVRIRIAVWAGGDKGTVLMFPGRTEYIEKYGRTAKDFQALGFSMVVIDWRGQGLSDRGTPNRAVGHVERFSDFQKDVAAVFAAMSQLDVQAPVGLLAHSMGGCIGLRALIEKIPVKAAVFTGPMWDIELNPLRRGAGHMLSALSRRMRFGHVFVPGTSAVPYMLSAPFEGNLLTRDPDMYQYMRAQLQAVPELALGGPSFAWVHEALVECKTLKSHPTPDIDCLTFLGTDERIVDQETIRDRMARWTCGKLQMIEGGRHEVLLDLPEVRQDIVNQSVALYLG